MFEIHEDETRMAGFYLFVDVEISRNEALHSYLYKDKRHLIFHFKVNPKK